VFELVNKLDKSFKTFEDAKAYREELQRKGYSKDKTGIKIRHYRSALFIRVVVY